MKKSKLLYFVLLFILFIIVLFVVFLYFVICEWVVNKEINENNENLDECFTQREEIIINGNSLEPLIKNNTNKGLLKGYYGCFSVEREDIIVYNYSGNENPLIKIVKAVPGDRIYLEKASIHERYNILVNDKILRNSEGKNYILDEGAYRLLSLYAENYNYSIPENSYLILGNNIYGSLDSTRFGLINRKDILGKVVL